MAVAPFAVRGITAETRAAIRSLAISQGRNLGDVVEEALLQYLETQPRQTLPDVTLRLAAGRKKRIPWPEDLVVVVEEAIGEAC
jgi:hypothetical protein